MKNTLKDEVRNRRRKLRLVLFSTDIKGLLGFLEIGNILIGSNRIRRNQVLYAQISLQIDEFEDLALISSLIKIFGRLKVIYKLMPIEYNT